MRDILAELSDCVVKFDMERIGTLALEAVKSGISAYDAIISGMAKGMTKVGEMYESGEFFVGELMMAGETMKKGVATLKPYLDKENIKPVGIVVLGTIKGDLHDIGKNIINTLLTASGFKVIDLGVDVDAKNFVMAALEYKPDIVAMSALLTSSMPNMKDVISELKSTRLSNKIKIIIGGAPVTGQFMRNVGADAYANDAVQGVEICKKWVRKKKS